MSTRIRSSLRLGIVLASLLSLAVSAGAQDSAPNRRGFVFGGGFTAGGVTFAGAAGRAVAVGPVMSLTVLPYGGGVVESRSIQVVDRFEAPPADAVWVVPFPKSANGVVLTMHGGFAFSPRLALLADVEVLAPYERGFNHLVIGAVVRVSPIRRLWVEAGPAASDLGYAYEGGATDSGAITGTGVLAAAGVTVVKKAKWTLDLQARYGKVWYDGFQARNLSFGLSVGRVRSGEAPPVQ